MQSKTSCSQSAPAGWRSVAAASAEESEAASSGGVQGIGVATGASLSPHACKLKHAHANPRTRTHVCDVRVSPSPGTDLAQCFALCRVALRIIITAILLVALRCAAVRCVTLCCGVVRRAAAPCGAARCGMMWGDGTEV